MRQEEVMLRQDEKRGEEEQQEEERQNEDMRREEERRQRQVEEEEQRRKQVELIKLEWKQRFVTEQCQEKVKNPEEMRKGRGNYEANSMSEGRNTDRSRSPIRDRSPIKTRSPIRSRSPIKTMSPIRGRSPIRVRSPIRSESPIRSRIGSISSNRSRSRSKSGIIQDKTGESEVLSKEQWVKLLTPGILKTMHEHGIASSGQSNVLQLLAKEVRDGLVVSATMGDGKFVSSNILPGGQEVARAMVAWPEYCMLRPANISVHKDKLLIGQATVMADQVFQQPLPAQGVSEFEYLNSQTLLFWGMKFPQEVPVRCSFKIRPAKN